MAVKSEGWQIEQKELVKYRFYGLFVLEASCFITSQQNVGIKSQTDLADVPTDFKAPINAPSLETCKPITNSLRLRNPQKRKESIFLCFSYR